MITKNVLIVDSTKYKNEILSIYKSASYNVHTCETAFDAIANLKIINYDLVVSQVQLPGDNAFELYYHITKNYPYMPIIMVTHQNVDEFFEKIINEGIGNVLSKPVNKNELLNLSEKLVSRKNIFGIENYISNIKTHKKISINSSRKIKEAIQIILNHIEKWQVQIENKVMLNLLLNEIIINAVYHAHGHTQKKIDRSPVVLNKDEYVDIFFAHSNNNFGISIIDYNGKLSKKIILNSIYNVVNEKKAIEESYITGEDISDMISETGRGIELVRQLSTEYYFVIEKNKRTEVILLFHNKMEKNEEKHSSLKIIEIE